MKQALLKTICVSRVISNIISCYLGGGFLLDFRRTPSCLELDRTCFSSFTTFYPTDLKTFLKPLKKILDIQDVAILKEYT